MSRCPFCDAALRIYHAEAQHESLCRCPNQECKAVHIGLGDEDQEAVDRFIWLCARISEAGITLTLTPAKASCLVNLVCKETQEIRLRLRHRSEERGHVYELSKPDEVRLALCTELEGDLLAAEKASIK